MKNIINIFLIILIAGSCTEEESTKFPVGQENWDNRKATIENFENYHQGKVYLPLYSYIYHLHDQRTFDLTITVSIRNISPTDSLYILNADYYNTIGENIRQYFESPIYIKPLETVEIIISEQDTEGGSGANFVFEWAANTDKNPPLFEAVMISTYGQQGLSFVTRGVPISE